MHLSSVYVFAVAFVLLGVCVSSGQCNCICIGSGLGIDISAVAMLPHIL